MLPRCFNHHKGNDVFDMTTHTTLKYFFIFWMFWRCCRTGNHGIIISFFRRKPEPECKKKKKDFSLLKNPLLFFIIIILLFFFFPSLFLVTLCFRQFLIWFDILNRPPVFWFLNSHPNGYYFTLFVISFFFWERIFSAIV